MFDKSRLVLIKFKSLLITVKKRDRKITGIETWKEITILTLEKQSLFSSVEPYESELKQEKIVSAWLKNLNQAQKATAKRI